MADDQKPWYERWWEAYVQSNNQQMEMQMQQDEATRQALNEGWEWVSDKASDAWDWTVDAYNRGQAIQQQNNQLAMEVTQIQNEMLGISPDITRSSLPDGSALVLKPTLVDEVCKFISEDLSTDLEGRMAELVALRDEKLSWAAEDPAVAADFDISTAQNEYNRINEKATQMVTDIRAIEAAIIKYSEGGGGVDVLNRFQQVYADNAYNPSPFAHTPYVPPTSNPDLEEPTGDEPDTPPGSNPPRDYPPVLDDDKDKEKDNEDPTITDPAIDGVPPVVVPTEETSPVDSQVIIESTGAETVANPTYAAKMATAFALEDTNEDGAVSDSELAEMFSSFGTSGASLIVPSGSEGAKLKVNSAGTVGAVGVTLAAAAALGGKIYYDKKHEDDEEDEMEDVVSDMIEIKTNATGADISTGMVSGLNMVELKEQLLHVGEESEA